MQFVKPGPDIPERLVQEHEDGHVVFFCGAGISYPAGLPGFGDLVEKLYKALGVPQDAVQKKAIKAHQFDIAIGLLEKRLDRKTVRKALASILTPNFGTSNATATHEALLALGRNRDGQMQLVTTNFDRLFEEVIKKKSLSFQRFQAPLLPIPKKRWDGLVYLHGLLPAKPTPRKLDSLVVSSGDFGLAYLTERWAARFMSELFRSYTVCFVGYSINDPVLRYMMDALAADCLRGESSREMYAFGSYRKGKEEEYIDEWQAKNVTPILYHEDKQHTYLHKTLKAWAETYRDGVRGKESIVAGCAMARPLASTTQDDFVGRVLWALSDPTGLPARRFAKLEPVPSLDWLEPLSEERDHHIDLGRLGVPPRANVNRKLAFSLTRRPSPYPLAPWMCLVDSGTTRHSGWDEVMRQLAYWLIRHLDDPVLLLWMVKRGGQLDDKLIRLIEYRLDELAQFERNGNKAELERIQKASPKAIPGPLMRTLWRLLLTGRIKSPRFHVYLDRWRKRFNRDGLTATLRLELREILTPYLSLREPLRPELREILASYLSLREPIVDDGGEIRVPERISDLVEWEIVLATDHVHGSLGALSKNEYWTAALPDLLSDFSTLLRDVLDLMCELGGAEDMSDRSYLYQPSIGEHPQNEKLRDWTALIDLVRDAWLAMAAQSPQRAALVAESWWHTRYPLFRRLVFFAAAQGSVIPHCQALGWLLEDGSRWLWSVETKREAIRLLVALAPKLEEEMQRQLEEAILAGPPQDIFKDDIQDSRRIRVDRETWLRLARLVEASVVLGAASKKRLDALSAQYPEWELAADQRDEFPYWIGAVNEWREFVATPRRHSDLIEWLRQDPVANRMQKDDWRQRCQDDFATTSRALSALARENVWPIACWREALQTWSSEKLLDCSWRDMAPVLVEASDEVLQTLAPDVSGWLQAIAKTFKTHEADFFKLAHRILELNHPDGMNSGDPVTDAINHPVGRVTEALLNWWSQRPLEDGQGLPEEIKPTFTKLCDTGNEQFRHGRVLLAVHVLPLFRVDSDWAEHLLPLFDWQRSETEARSAWEGFLSSPRLYRPLMEVLKEPFLETASRYEEALGEHKGQYASFLTFAALDPGDTFKKTELAQAIGKLPQDGLQQSAQALVSALESAGKQRGDYWNNRVKPYLQGIWPKTRSKMATPAIAESLGHLCIAAQEKFPEALELLSRWLESITHPYSLVHLLYQSELCGKFPWEALDFLALIIGDQTEFPPSDEDLKGCLDAIRTSDSKAETDPRYEKLDTYRRQYGKDSD